MSKDRKDKGRLPPFIPLFRETLESPAWRALSHGAKVLYVCLKKRLGQHNNGRLYLSQRDAKKELGSGSSQIARWFRELQHYGFIVKTAGSGLGLDGKGFAPHWRLTEAGNSNPMKESICEGTKRIDFPTKDFLNWDRKPFVDSIRPWRKKTESRTRNQVRGVPETGYREQNQKPGTLPAASVPETRYRVGVKPKPETRYISRLTTTTPIEACSEDAPKPKRAAG